MFSFTAKRISLMRSRSASVARRMVPGMAGAYAREAAGEQASLSCSRTIRRLVDAGDGRPSHPKSAAMTATWTKRSAFNFPLRRLARNSMYGRTSSSIRSRVGAGHGEDAGGHERDVERQLQPHSADDEPD